MLRRHEPEPTILDFGHHPNGHGHHNDTNSRLGRNDNLLSSSTNSNGHLNHSSTGPGGHSHHPFAHTAAPMTPSAHHATQTIQQTVSALATSPTAGLASHTVPAIRQMSGPNEFEVGAKDPLWKRFGGQFGDPLIMLLLGSAAVSTLVGNYDDAASIVAAILIVVTGKPNPLHALRFTPSQTRLPQPDPTKVDIPPSPHSSNPQSGSSKNNAPRSHSRRSTS